MLIDYTVLIGIRVEVPDIYFKFSWLLRFLVSCDYYVVKLTLQA